MVHDPYEQVHWSQAMLHVGPGNILQRRILSASSWLAWTTWFICSDLSVQTQEHQAQHVFCLLRASLQGLVDSHDNSSS